MTPNSIVSAALCNRSLEPLLATDGNFAVENWNEIPLGYTPGRDDEVTLRFYGESADGPAVLILEVRERAVDSRGITEAWIAALADPNWLEQQQRQRAA